MGSWFIFALGAIVGSFLNVCIYRMPRDLSIVLPGSFCTNCKTPIPWYENIPLLSYLLLRGRCPRCKTSFSVRYFIVELTSALVWWFLWQKAGLSVQFAASVFFFSTLIVTIVADFETGLIPDAITVPGMVAGLAFSVIGFGNFPETFWAWRLLESGLGLLAGGGVLFLTGWIGKLAFRKDSMGGGDIKLLAMMGAFLGVTKVMLVFLLAPFPALPLALWQRFVNKQETIPFGPFLALAGALLFVRGDDVLNFLAKLYGV
ncbi:MAG TPA: prepilin peptidase [Candidatus Omnitrophota bacterium]|nr:prepilin peptidase [Candidatus Omnitrophota bacterium]HPS36142.1 prepilin peptidase [Candidatus Omnitrophota bacterium]